MKEKLSNETKSQNWFEINTVNKPLARLIK